MGEKGATLNFGPIVFYESETVWRSYIRDKDYDEKTDELVNHCQFHSFRPTRTKKGRNNICHAGIFSLYAYKMSELIRRPILKLIDIAIMKRGGKTTNDRLFQLYRFKRIWKHTPRYDHWRIWMIIRSIWLEQTRKRVPEDEIEVEKCGFRFLGTKCNHLWIWMQYLRKWTGKPILK